MPSKHFIFLFIILFVGLFCNAQKTSDTTAVDGVLIKVQDTIEREPLNILGPSKAAFYSAVLPGLGQAYNKKYWKIPLVYAAIGIPVYFYIDNDRVLGEYRDEFKRRLAGFEQDRENAPFPNVSDDGLIRAQETLRRNKELSLLIAIGMYALNIIDANVDAHLLQFNVDENLAIKPHFKYNEWENTSDLGVTLNFKF